MSSCASKGLKKGLPSERGQGAGEVAADDEGARAVVPADEGVPKRLARTGQAHGEDGAFRGGKGDLGVERYLRSRGHGEGDRNRPERAVSEAHLVDDARVVGLAEEAAEG